MSEVNGQPAVDMRVVEGALRLHRRLAASGLYLAALVVFLLPFASVSCGPQTVFTLSGLDLAFGRELGTQFGTSAALGITAGHLDSHPWLVLGLLAPVAGLVTAMIKPAVQDRITVIVLASVGTFGLLLMLAVLGDIAATNSAVQGGAGCQGQPGCVNLAAAVQVNPGPGVWLEALLDVAMMALGAVWLSRWAPAPAPSGATPEPSESRPG